MDVFELIFFLFCLSLSLSPFLFSLAFMKFLFHSLLFPLLLSFFSVLCSGLSFSLFAPDPLSISLFKLSSISQRERAENSSYL